MILSLCVLLAVVGYGTYRYALRGLPQLDKATDYHPYLPTFVLDRHGRVAAEYGEERRIVVPFHKIPKHVVQAFLAAEDATFFEHGGVDLSAILRAVIKNLTSGKVRQGASTITQQVAKTFFLSSERTLWRKIREVALAHQLEQALSKEEILYLYLNQIYFGAGAYGVESAANVYFGKHITDVTVAEAAILAGLPKAPSRYSPAERPELARQRQLYVIARMEENGFLSPSQAQAAKAEKVAIRRWQNPAIVGGSFAEHVRRYLVEKYGEELVLRGGLVVETGLDLDLQRRAQEAVRKGVLELEKRHGYRGPFTSVTADRYDTFIAQLNEEARKPEPGEVVHYIGELAKDASTSATNISFNKTVRALVVRVEKERAILQTGYGLALLPLFEADWTMPFDVKRLARDYRVKDLRKTLRPGDVVEIRFVDLTSLIKPAADRWRQAKLPPGYWAATLMPSPRVQAALLAVDPQTAEARAMIGGYDFATSQYNRAVQARRQPGSAFKPVVYAAAIARGYTPATTVVDSPDTFENMAQDTTETTLWKPKNFDGVFLGPITLRTALMLSRNVPTLRLAQDVGIDGVLQMAVKLGITSPLERNFSIALGSAGVSLLEMTTMYTAFDAGGVRREIKFIRRVRDRTGKVLEQFVPDWVIEGRVPTPAERDESDARYYQAEQALDPQAAYIMTYLLRSVVQGGTAARVGASFARPAAGKTGTTNDNVDSWFIGFTPDLVAGVWVGMDEPGQNLGPFENGADAAIPIWLDFMSAAHAGLPARDWPVPDKIVFRDVDADTGLLPGSSSTKIVAMPFVYGTEPTAAATEAPVSADDLFRLDMGL